MPRPLDKLLADLARGPVSPVYLVHGDLVLAEPAAERIAGALAAAAGCAVETHRHPPALTTLLADLRTFSLFAAGKVVLAVDTAALADRDAAGDLIDAAAEVAPRYAEAKGGDGGEASLPPRDRQAASHLLQALRLFDLDPYAGAPEEAVGQLPAWALEGGQSARRKRGKRQVEDLRAALAGLLAAARRAEVAGIGSGDLPELAAAVREGLPPGHALVLAERAVAAGHPVVAALEERGAVVQVGSVEAGRGGAWEGLDLLAAELERQTGVAIARDALAELARRTLRQEDSRGKKGGGFGGGGGAAPGGGADADSSARFAGEYRKLANLVQGRAQEGAAAGKALQIERRLVEQAVEDRGEEDVWQLLDAVAQGRADEALDRLERLVAGAEDPGNARLSFFALFASFCRQLTAIRGLMRVARVPPGEGNYARFKDRLAPALQGEIPGLPDGARNPLAGLHPFRLHRAYLAASRMPEALLAHLPSDVLEAELRLKGESGEADAALALLVTRVAAAAGGKARG